MFMEWVHDITDQKQAEKILRESEETLRITLHSIGDAVVSTDMQGCVLDMNPVAEALTGWRKKEAYRQPLERVFHIINEKTRLPVESPVINVLKSGNIVGLANHTLLISKDGQEIPIADSGAPIRNDAGEITGVVLVFRDQTQERGAQEALESNYTLLRIVGETARFGGWDVDLEKNITNWSDTVADIHEMPHGYAPAVEEAILFYAPEWREKISQVFTDCAQKGLPYDEEMEIITSKGNRVWVRTIGRAVKDGNGNIIKVQGSFQDITESKLAAEVLQEREDRLSKIMLAANDGMWDWDLITNQVYFDPRYYQMSGYDIDEFPHDLAEFQKRIYPDDLHYVMREADGHLQGKIDRFDVKFRFLKKSGEWQWIQAKGIIVERHEDGTPRRFVGTHRDISELKLAEEALKASEEKFRLLADTAKVMISIVADTDGSKYLYVNDEWQRICGYNKEEAQNIRPIDVLAPEYKQQVLDNARKRAEGKQIPENYELKIITKSGEIRDLKFSSTMIDFGKQKALLTTAIDITDRKKTEEALRQSEEMMRNSQSVAHICSYSTNLNTNEIGKSHWVCSPEFYKIFGIDKSYPHTIEGWAAFIHPDYREEIFAYHESVVKEKKSFNREYKMIRINDGAERWVHGTGELEYDENGEPIRMHGAIQDITDRKEAEAEKEKLQGQLIQAQKMESVGRLAGGVAHDFNNMLSVIMGRTELAMEHVDPDQPLYNDLQEIHNAAQRSANLTRQLLTFARKQTISPKVTDLNETVEEILKMLRRLIGENINLSWRPGQNLAPVKVDPSQIDQILANLCVNARDAISLPSPSGNPPRQVGKIIIETDLVSFDEAYCAVRPSYVPGNYVLLAVSDNGCGMDKETVSHLFEPFFTTKEVGKGTGLGLASVYGAVKQNNGFINVYSEPGQGSTFKIYLPQHQTKDQLQANLATTKATLRGRETILLVEDEPAILSLATMMLESLGYFVIASNTPGEAIRMANEHSGTIDLLMTDVVMPEMNGRELAKNLLAIYPGIKRLFMSGYTADIIAHHGILDTGVYFIQKPFSLKILGEKLREVLEKNHSD
jgi:two-component system, cell cycle sensor histidine kinase and response regulator CckA